MGLGRNVDIACIRTMSNFVYYTFLLLKLGHHKKNVLERSCKMWDSSRILLYNAPVYTAHRCACKSRSFGLRLPRTGNWSTHYSVTATIFCFPNKNLTRDFRGREISHDIIIITSLGLQFWNKTSEYFFKICKCWSYDSK